MTKISVIIPCLNEEGNIEQCVNRVSKSLSNVPHEIIVVDDGSTDKTAEIASNLDVKLVSYKPNRGKGYAVRAGLEKAEGHFSVIQDADMTSQPEELPQIMDPLLNGQADFVNGTRLIHPMEEGAMKSLHIPGNKMFALLVSTIVGQKLTDTLCGFKAFPTELRTSLKEDSWPDFELILEAQKRGYRITDVPIHYKARKAGTSKMKTFKHGYDMFEMLGRAVLKRPKKKKTNVTALHSSEGYDIIRNPDSSFHSEKYRKLFKKIEKNRDLRVLELGCGTGVYTKFLANDFDNVLATDLDPKMLVESEKRAKCDYTVLDSSNFKDHLSGQKFDVVFGVSILHHIDKNKRIDTFKHAHDVLERGGYFIMAEPNALSPVTRLFQHRLREDSISRFEFKRLAKESGFKIIDLREILFRNPMGKFMSNANIIEPLAEKIGMGLTVMMVAQKSE